MRKTIDGTMAFTSEVKKKLPAALNWKMSGIRVV